MRQTYPAAGPVFSYRWDDGAADTVSIDDGAAGMEVFGQAVGGEGVRRGWIRNASGKHLAFAAGWVGEELHVWLDGRQYIFQAVATQARTGLSVSLESDILAPMPGTVVRVMTAEGQDVAAGEALLVMESMKMELVIEAPRNGTVRRLAVEEGAQVDRGMRLVELEPSGPAE